MASHKSTSTLFYRFVADGTSHKPSNCILLKSQNEVAESSFDLPEIVNNLIKWATTKKCHIFSQTLLKETDPLIH